MTEIFSTFWPLVIFCIVLFIVCMIYTSIIDKITSGVRKLFGINKKTKKNWHSIDEFEDQDKYKK